MGKDLFVSRLCDVYGALLTQHRREILRDYYDDDLSLAEIAENNGITRQAALCSIKQAEKQLRTYEEALGVVAMSDKIESGISAALELIDNDAKEAKRTLARLLTEIGR